MLPNFPSHGTGLKSGAKIRFLFDVTNISYVYLSEILPSSIIHEFLDYN